MKRLNFFGASVHGVAALLFIFVGLSGCSKSGDRNLSSSGEGEGILALDSDFDPQAAGVLQLRGLDGSALSGARVRIGWVAGNPFTGNELVADGAGRISVPKAWVDEAPVTVEATGYVKTTWLHLRPQGRNLLLRAIPEKPKPEVAGKITGFGALPRDGNIDAGVVIPALQRRDLPTFQLSDVVSPATDPITVMGRTMPLPSNVGLPRQTESYSIFPVTLDKPNYRLPVSRSGATTVVTAHARFPLGDVVDVMRGGGTFSDAMNFLEFRSVGLFAVKTGVAAQDLTVGQIPLVPGAAFHAPSFAAGNELFVMAVSQQNGLLFPTDVKAFAPSETRVLNAPQGQASAFYATLLRKKGAPGTGPDAEQDSAAVLDPAAASNIEFIPAPDQPQIAAGNIRLSPPAAPRLVDRAFTFASLSAVETSTSGSRTVEQKTPVWDVYCNGWVQQLDLPDFNPATSPKHRWNVLFGGVPVGISIGDAGPEDFDVVTHAARSAADTP